MTKKSPAAPNQVKLIMALTQKIESSNYLFITDHEQTTGQKVLEGEWLHRLEVFCNDPESGIGSDPFEISYAKALVTRRYAKWIPKRVVEKLTKPLVPPSKLPPSKEHMQKLLRNALGIRS